MGMIVQGGYRQGVYYSGHFGKGMPIKEGVQKGTVSSWQVKGYLTSPFLSSAEDGIPI